MVTKKNRKERHRKKHPVVIIKPYYIKGFRQLIYLCYGLLRVEDGNKTAEDSYIEHIVLNMLVLNEEQKWEEGNVCSADVYKPGVAQMSGQIRGVGRNIGLEKMKQKTEDQKTE